MSFPDDLASEIAQDQHDERERARRDAEQADPRLSSATGIGYVPPSSMEEALAQASEFARRSREAREHEAAFYAGLGLRRDHTGTRWVRISDGGLA